MKSKYVICALSLIPIPTLINSDIVHAYFKPDIFNIENKSIDRIVDIKDKNLLKAINNQLGRGDVLDSVTIEDMENLTTLNANNKGITSIKGIEKAINLTSLDLSKNRIVDVSYLSSLTELKTLYLYDNQISNISSLENLTSLKDLRLYNNQISDISPLENLTSLTTLRLDGNEISDISSLENLTSLTRLELHTNQISDISSLENLTSLTYLYLNNNQISDISPLENLTNLTTLYLHTNQIKDISSLENLTSLKDLRLYNNQISDISSLENLTSLTRLELYTNQISDISSLENLTSLTTLYLDNNQISDISPLENLTSLTGLRLNNNQISDISSLENLTSLKDLRLHNNQISDISSLENLTSLTFLQLANNQILDISSLENLTSLTTLYLHNNQIKDISSLENLTSLTNLNITNQKPNITTSDFKTEFNSLDINIVNPLVGLNNNFNLSNISNRGVYENNQLKWNNLSLGSHSNTFNFSQEVKIGSATSTFSGTATINFNIIDGGAPESDHTSEFDENDFGIYTTVTATDLGEGVSHLIHKGIRQELPYRFKYDVYDSSNNIVDVYDLAGNKEEYQVKLKDSDISTINTGLDALINKDDRNHNDISYFRTIINELDESSNKDLLQDKLNSISITDTLERKTATANIDIYIKSENMLSMTLSTNSITFEDYSGVDDLSIDNAINISINSSLPYQLNAYLPVEIENSNKSNIMNKEILNIKESNEVNYQYFDNTTDKIVLKDNCVAGNDLSHSVDLKLKGGIAHEKDVYKTTIKFEVEQK